MLFTFIISIIAWLITAYSRSFMSAYIVFSVAFVVYLLVGLLNQIFLKKPATFKQSLLLLLPFIIDNLSGQYRSIILDYKGFNAQSFLIVLLIGILGFGVGSYFGKKRWYMPLLLPLLVTPLLFYVCTPYYISNFTMLSTQQKLNNYTFLDEKQKKISVKDFQGKITVINAWYKSCGYCKLYYPIIQKLKDKYKNNSNILFYGLNIGLDDFGALTYFRKQYPYTFPLLYDEQKMFAKEVIGENAAPFITIIDQQGVIRYKCEGYRLNDLTAKDYENLIENAIKSIY